MFDSIHQAQDYQFYRFYKIIEKEKKRKKFAKKLAISVSLFQQYPRMSIASLKMSNVLPSPRCHARIRIIGVKDKSFDRIDAKKYRGKSVVFPGGPKKVISVHATVFHGSFIYQNMETGEVGPARVLRLLQKESKQRLRGRNDDELVQFPN